MSNNEVTKKEIKKTIKLEKKLIALEKKYSKNTVVKNIKRTKISNHEKTNYKTTHQGADRMKSKYHNYAEWYSIFLQKYINRECIFCEVGILTGVGLAGWCDIFNKCNIIGYDIDINIFNKNKQELIKLGAFSKQSPQIYSFDQFEDNTEYIKKHCAGKKISIVIDDGNHETVANIKTFQSFLPLLADEFVYIIEDNDNVHKILCKNYRDKYYIYYKDDLTVITSRNDKAPISSVKEFLLI